VKSAAQWEGVPDRGTRVPGAAIGVTMGTADKNNLFLFSKQKFTTIVYMKNYGKIGKG